MKMKKTIFMIILSCMFLTGCNRKADTITIEGRATDVFDNSIIQLKEGWFVEEYSIDYENKQIILRIEEVEE